MSAAPAAASGDAGAAASGDADAAASGVAGVAASGDAGAVAAEARRTVARIAVLGVSGGRVPPGTEALLAGADVVAGGGAVLHALAPARARRVVLGAGLTDTLEELAAEPGAVCVLASGDPGFFGVVRALGAAAGPERLDVHPAPSSVALAFARLGLPWDDALVVSAHGRDPRPAIHTALRHPKVAILTEPRAPAAMLAQALESRTVLVAEALGTPAERIRPAAPGLEYEEPNVVIALADGAGTAAGRGLARADRWALPEDAFEHRAGMITKAEVRAVALAALGPGVGDLVWDVGCGSGSVAIECARLGAAAIAIDAHADAIAMTARNAATHGVPVGTVHGSAPDALGALPDPDAAFVGGGGAALDAILDHVAPRTHRAVVVTVAVVERIAPTLERLASHGLEASATTIQASRVRPIPGGHRLAAENPVTVITGRRA
jgi:precorrin-6B C5,15-methyltransferase / cobalt-precorrin-6B C5,C15-methyltransferase